MSATPSTNKRRKPTPRKKTTRACNHCHKAHMTCDEARPCKRCYQRGLQATCVDAPRKQKKYLMDVPEDMTRPSASELSHSGTNTSVSPPALSSDPAAVTAHNSFGSQVVLPPLPAIINQMNQDQSHSRDIPNISDLYPPQLSFGSMRQNGQQEQEEEQQDQRQHYIPSLSTNHQAPKQRSKFMSNAANSEYTILSDILRQDELGLGISKTFDSQSPQSSILRRDSTAVSAGSTPTPQSVQHDLYSSYRHGDKIINQYMIGFVQDKIVTYPEVMKSIEGEKQFQADTPKSDHNSAVLSFSIAINEAAENGNGTSTNSQSPWGLLFKESEEIYAKVRQPFSYTPGFHALIQYLKTRFARNELIQMAKAMASYRPSFIACTNTLKEDDLIFMEQCFQRTLLEYDKFISLSGTPTIVWRRTGQIAYVSEEFCILTGWSKEQLLNKITFIVELMDDASVLEYFNLFSTIAYGDFRGATMAGCTLRTPESSRIKTTCMWTLKRDVFGIPMMIIGNFLPILE